MKLIIHNYGILEDVSIDMSPGLTTLSGQNGSGKSTTVDALFFALTGEPMDGRNISELVNWEAVDGKAAVTLVCPEFTVTRTIKSGLTHKLELPDGTVLTKKADVNAWIFDHYKIDNPGVLKEVFFSAQLHATDLFDTTNSTRLTMLSRLFGLDRLEQCRSVIYRVLSETPIPTVNDELIHQLSERVEQSEEAVRAAELELKTAEKGLEDLKFDAEEYERVRNAPTDAEKSSHHKALQEAHANVTAATAHYSELSGKIEDCRQFREMKQQYDLRAQRKQLLDQMNELCGGVSLTKLKEARHRIGVEEEVLRMEIKKLQERATDTTTCPLTGNTPCIDYLRFHDPQLVAAEVEAKNKSLEAMQTDLEQLEELIGQEESKEKLRIQLQYQVDQIELGPDPTYSEEEVDKALADFGDFDLMCNEHSMLDSYINIWEAEAHKLECWWSAHSLEEVVTDAEKQEWEDRKRAFDCAELKVTSAKDTLISKQGALSQDRAMLTQMLADRDAVLRQKQRIENLKDVRDLLSRENLQRALMQRALKRVNKEIASCSRIFNFKYRVFLTETGDIVFQDDTIEPKDVRFLSGGQKYTAAIITRIAFARVLNTAFEFMVLDEPSICLDDTSREMLAALLSALNARFKSEGKYLVVPTHDELILAQGNNFKVKEN